MTRSDPLHLDFETRSAADLTKVGAHRYAEDPTTRIVVTSYRFGRGPVQRWVGETPPDEVVLHITRGGTMVGHNQSFERAIWNARIAEGKCPSDVWVPRLHPEKQDCTLARAASAGLPKSLGNLGEALGLSVQKDKEGHALMMKMCKPKAKRKGQGVHDHEWHEEPADVQRLAAYCDRDVETECAADAALPPLPDRERRLWILDQQINDRGFAVDTLLAGRADLVVREAKRRADAEMARITGDAITSTSQAKRLQLWLTQRGIPCTSVADGEVDELLVCCDLISDTVAAEALQLRRNSAGAFKFEAMLRAVCADGRVRGCLQYYGTHGGRWAGRVVQPQNFKRVAEEDEADVARMFDLLRRYDNPVTVVDAWQMLSDRPVLEVLTLCARGMIIAKPRHKLVDADFSNIEGRLAAWFAGETWKIRAFEAYDAGVGPDLYKIGAANVLTEMLCRLVLAEEVTKSQRQNEGKVPELACGYQGGRNAFRKMAAKFGLYLSDAQIDRIVAAWRAANPHIVAAWAELQNGAIEAVSHPGMVVPCLGGKVQYLKPKDQDVLWCLLPSGRVISYAKPQVGWKTKVVTEDGDMLVSQKQIDEAVAAGKSLDEWSTFGITFLGEKNGRLRRLDLYGGMQFAHVVSGTARDLLVDAMFAVEAAGYALVLTIHDELLAEVPLGFGSADLFKAIITAAKALWAKGLPLVSAAWEDVRYVK